MQVDQVGQNRLPGRLPHRLADQFGQEAVLARVFQDWGVVVGFVVVVIAIAASTVRRYRWSQKDGAIRSGPLRQVVSVERLGTRQSIIGTGGALGLDGNRIGLNHGPFREGCSIDYHDRVDGSRWRCSWLLLS